MASLDRAPTAGADESLTRKPPRLQVRVIASQHLAGCWIHKVSLPAAYARHRLVDLVARLGLGPRHCDLILAVRITLAHFSVSSAMSLLKSDAESGRIGAPKSANRALIARSASPALISWLSLSVMSEGVPF